MTSNNEEQEMEAQALEAIFDYNFKIIDSNIWSIDIYPEQTDEYGNDTSNAVNHVACKLIVTLPIDYPEISLPIINIEIIKGLSNEHIIELINLAIIESKANENLPSIFAITENIREWLIDNNIIGLDDMSMHAMMLRKEKDKLKLIEKQKQLQNIVSIKYKLHCTTCLYIYIYMFNCLMYLCCYIFMIILCI